MEHATKSPGDQQSQDPAARRIARPGAIAAFVDDRSEAAVQRELADVARTSPKLVAQTRLTDAIRDSPRMARQRAQVDVIRGESVALRGRPEADVSSAGSPGRAPQRAPARAFDRSSRTFPSALPAAWQSVAQLVNLPKDSTGELEKIKFRMGEQEITAKDLQIALIKKLSAVEGIKAGFGYRLTSLLYKGGGTFGKNTTYPEEDHGMGPWPTAAAGVISDSFKDIVYLVAATLSDADQLGYLDENFKKINKKHAIVIDVDWYLARTQSDVGFHKDSRGTTLFVNLTYSNEQRMEGASTKWDREGQPELEKNLPKAVRKDLKKRRKQYDKSQPHPEYGDLTESTVEPYARLSFADPAIWHSTPRLGHRIEREQALPDPVNLETLKRYVATAGYEFEALVKIYFETHSEKPTVGVFWKWLKATYPIVDKYNRHGISSKLAPVNEEKLTEAVRKNKRPLSDRLNADKTGKLQEALNEEAKRARTFIRTWVRLVKPKK